MASATNVRTSFRTVMDCLPSIMYCTEAFSASCPVTQYLETSVSAAKASAIARAVPSLGARMNTSPLSSALAAVRLASARFLATLKSQLVVTCPMILPISSRVNVALSCNATASEEFLITKVPSAILGCNTFQAPSKNRKALLSDDAPAYRYRGRPVPAALSTRYCAWAAPTDTLSKVT